MIPISVLIVALLVNMGLLVANLYLHFYFPIPFNVVAIVMFCITIWSRVRPKQIGKV